MSKIYSNREWELTLVLKKNTIRETFKPLTKDANYQMREAFVKMLGNADEMVTGVALDISDETRERKFLSFKNS